VSGAGLLAHPLCIPIASCRAVKNGCITPPDQARTGKGSAFYLKVIGIGYFLAFLNKQEATGSSPMASILVTGKFASTYVLTGILI
jgi:hypothetical protein